MDILPLTNVVLPRKHTILLAFDRLAKGKSIIVVNDHNPFLLYYQLLLDRGNSFAWDYLQKGPERWRVRITKLLS